jgi:hypothetical protein
MAVLLDRETEKMFEISADSPHAAIEKIAEASTAIGAGTAISSGIGGFISQNHEIIWFIGVVCGCIAGIGGLIVMAWYKHKDNQRLDKLYRMKEIEHEIRVNKKS